MIDIQKRNAEDVKRDSEILNNKINHGNIEDLEFIQMSFIIRKGWLLTLAECCELWEDYSQSLQAGWIFIPKQPYQIIEMIENERRFKGWDYYVSKFTEI